MNHDFGIEKFSLSGKVALVTGASGFLGKHFCRGLASAGANLVLVDLEQKALDAQAHDLSKDFPTEVCAMACDVSSAPQIQDLKNRTLRAFPRIDILHNNAATKGRDPAAFFESTENFDPRVWREVMSVNLDGAFLVAQAFGGEMAKSGCGGSIIQTSSIYGVVGPDQRIYREAEHMGLKINSPAVYSASKAGLVGLTKYLATLWGAKKVRVNTLVPGGVVSGQNQTFQQNYSQRVPLRRMANAEEMVGALIFLASDASSYVTGHTLIVDGGLSSW